MADITNGKEEMLTIVVLGVIAIVALAVLKVGGKEIVLAIGGGLIGFLKGGTK